MNVEATQDIAARFMALFAGDDQCHGTYDQRRLHVVGAKMEMKDDRGNGALTLPGGPSIHLWASHLDGTIPLGIRPVRADGRCLWGVIDVDDYGLSHADMVAAIEAASLPLTVCKSKSGGAHLLLFLSNWSSTDGVNAALRRMANQLGLPPTTEIFPPKSGPANWVNMPYLGGDETGRFAIKQGGLGMTVGEFLPKAEALRIAPEQLVRLGNAKERDTGKEEYASAQRGLKRFCAEVGGQAEGGRAKLLYGRAKDMGRMVGAGWINEDEVYSALLGAAIESGLGLSEATGHIGRGLSEGRLEGPTEAPAGDRYPDIDHIVVLVGGEQTMWTVTVAGFGDITLPVKEVMHYWTFGMRCAEKLRVSFRQMKVDAWSDRINAALIHAETREIPRDETVEIMFLDELREFLMDRHRGEQLEDLLLRKPVHVPEDDRIYFRFKDFVAFVGQRSGGPFRGASVQRLGHLFAQIGESSIDHGKTTKRLKRSPTEVRWARMSMFEPTSEHSLPALAPEPV